MCATSLALSRILGELAARGPLTFARFMELALYDPEVGYYASSRARIGKTGDFFTNVSVGPVFGQVLAGQIREMWGRIGTRRLVLVEQGANDGQLAADILGALDEETLPLVDYWIVEPLPILRRLQQQALKPFAATLRWAGGLGELPEFDGVHLSNELIDALPFHLVRSTGEKWQELVVECRDGRLAFGLRKPGSAISNSVSRLPQRARGTIAELRPAASAWIEGMAGKLRAGFVLIVDFGFSREQLLAPHRTEGTLACYREHRRDDRPLEDPGEKDITAHVDFSALAESAREAGFELEGYADQYHFLVGASQGLLKRFEGAHDAASQKTLRCLQTLLHPESLGTQFRCLALSKGVKNSRRLSGFQFAPDPSKQLFSGAFRGLAEGGVVS
jgi:SAM-dependent MidA family methyltransferase